jgi:hypothetical protein
MRRIELFFTAILIILSFNNTSSFSQDDNKDASMKAYMDYMTPGKEHQMLAKQTGDWKFDLQLWMDPAAPPVSAKGTATFEMILGGRYQMSKQSAEMMGMPFSGINVIGFDNAKKVFVNSWIDNMGTGMMYAEGTYDEATKTVTYKGKSVDPMSGKDEDFRQTIIYTDDNNFTVEMYMLGKDDKEFKSMDTKYTRK